MDFMKPSGRSKARSVALLVAGILAGSVLIQPAVAHFRPRIGHLIRHVFNRADPRYYNEGQTVDRAQNANNATNAGTLDNIDSTGFLRTGSIVASGNVSDTAIDNFTSATMTSIISTTITVPTNGFLYINGTLSVEDDGSLAGSADLGYRLRLDTTPIHDNDESYELDTDDPGPPFNLAGAASAVVPVAAGAHTVHLDAIEFGTGSFIEGRSITAIFVPEGTGVTIPVRGSVRSPGRN
jgi:hypothetical protein